MIKNTPNLENYIKESILCIFVYYFQFCTLFLYLLRFIFYIILKSAIEIYLTSDIILFFIQM